MIKRGHEWYDREILSKLGINIVELVKKKAEDELKKQYEIRRETILKLMRKEKNV